MLCKEGAVGEAYQDAVFYDLTVYARSYRWSGGDDHKLWVTLQGIADYDKVAVNAVRCDYDTVNEKLVFKDVQALPLEDVAGDAKCVKVPGQMGAVNDPDADYFMTFIVVTNLTQDGTDKGGKDEFKIKSEKQ